MTIKALKGDTPEQQIVFGEVYAPDRPDAQGEFMRAEEIASMAHDFIRQGKMGQIDLQHDGQVIEGPSIVESFIARKGDPDFIEGAWVIGMHIPNPDLWEAVKKGEINGFSMEALVTRHEQEVPMEIPPVVQGLTSKSDNSAPVSPHEHRFFVSYDDNGIFRGGITDNVLGHQHVIKAGTHTETTEGHSHRFSAVDNVVIGR
jgi:hypothetical protein